MCTCNFLSQSGQNRATLGQSKKSCVVYGMPKIAFEMGAVDKQVDIEKMALSILDALGKKGS